MSKFMTITIELKVEDPLDLDTTEVVSRLDEALHNSPELAKAIYTMGAYVDAQVTRISYTEQYDI